MSLTQSNLCTYTRMIHNGPVQLASKIGQRLHTVLRCHLTQASKELKIDITLLIDVNKYVPADDKLLCQPDCYGVLLFCSCTTYVRNSINYIMNKPNTVYHFTQYVATTTHQQ